MRRPFAPIVLDATLVAAALAAAGCAGHHDPGLITASGHVEATDVRLATKIPGRLVEFKLEEGDRVTAGQVLGQIDRTDLELSIQQAKADEGQTAADLNLRLAGTRKEDIAEQEARLQSARVEMDAAQRDFERMQSLLDRGSGTTKARDDAQARRDTATAQVQAMQEALLRMKAGSRREEIEAARARQAAAAARVAQIEQQLEDATITSPVTGVVTEKIAEQGELLQPGAGLCVVTNLSDAWLTVYVTGPDLGRIRLGQEAEVRTDDGQTRQGKVRYIASEAEFTPKNVQTRDERVKLVYRIKIGLDNADGMFKPGMPAEARLKAAAA
ncbi:MAG TPA: efflux RND transporter periplasmic adaptor subunit [Candidatus Polarisedimenticolia bacterium]|jgi:HlyD family secretion protein|nr:efflux RND transporter periplasmic adaptor subunit [Candidatus Polarisedimenticolia bacterium]